MKKIAIIGNYLPRQCGIATFTTDLCDHVARCDGALQCLALAMNDQEEGYDYPERVRFEIPQEHLFSYQSAAEFLNQNDVDVACLQHEYGIFGGADGSHVLTLMRNLSMPVVTTLHTVLHDPRPNQRRVIQEIVRLSDRLVVMSQKAIDLLEEVYDVPGHKVDLVPHGIPEVPFVDPSFHKDKFGVEGKFVLMTFGLLSRNKGIEYVIEALPAIVERHPNVVYLVLGATHPRVLQQEGEAYRERLYRLVREKGLEKNVAFQNRFVGLRELTEYLSAADVYVTPYLNPAQIVSGTLAYTMGAGKAVISTPYWYAEELLADGRGLIVPFRDSAAISEKVLYLIENESERNAMREQAYLHGRHMVWSKVAEKYLETFEKTRQNRMEKPRAIPTIEMTAGMANRRLQEIPPLHLGQLARLTDGTGVLQHAIFTAPNYHEGYTTDDNARALIAMVQLEELKDDVRERLPYNLSNLAHRYLAFLWYAFNPKTGRFRNFASYDRRWLEETGSEDSHARALWALGTVMARSRNEGLRGAAARLFELAFPAARRFSGPRGWAFSLLGLNEYLRLFPGDRAVSSVREALAERLLEAYRANAAGEWCWFEEVVSYCNPVLSRALLASGSALGREELIECGLESLEWLVDIQRSEQGHFAPIGCNGFYRRGAEKARFDQQPVEAYAMVAACLEGLRVSGEAKWRRRAWRAFGWFLGENDLGLPLYDPETGGCRDGLQIDRLNQNQGAESTISYLLAALEMLSLEKRARLSAGELDRELPAAG